MVSILLSITALLSLMHKKSWLINSGQKGAFMERALTLVMIMTMLDDMPTLRLFMTKIGKVISRSRWS